MHETSACPRNGESVCSRLRSVSHVQGEHRRAEAVDRRRIESSRRTARQAGHAESYSSCEAPQRSNRNRISPLVPRRIVLRERDTGIEKSRVTPAADSASTKSNRPLPISGAIQTAWATAAAACDSLVLGCRFRKSAAPPETKGALKEVPHPAAYVLNG